VVMTFDTIVGGKHTAHTKKIKG